MLLTDFFPQFCFYFQITAPADLTVLMSAVRQGEPETVEGGSKRKHKFLQKIPIQVRSNIC